MMLVLDANILVRAVLGEQTDFFAPDVSFNEARKSRPQ
jgi:hypothetical protein